MIEFEKIGKKKKNLSIKRKIEKHSQHNPVDVIHSSFFDELRMAEIEDIKIDFDKLIDEITRQGEKFYKNPTYEHLKLYKSMIREFLKYVTDHMLAVEHHTGGKLKQKIYTVSKLVDKKLNALTEMVLSQQAQNINLVSILDEIRGLLVDLYK